MCYNNKMQIKEQQLRDSIRMVWNAMPNSKALMAKASIPQAFHYTVLDENEHSVLEKSPIRCLGCQSYMNPYNRIHIGKQHYTCCICKVTNPLPLDYLDNKDSMPSQMTLAYSSMLLARQQPSTCKEAGFLFVIDIAVQQKQLEAIKKSIIELVNGIDENRVVGLITYNKYVYLHDLASEMESTIMFSPHHAFWDEEFLNLVSLSGLNDQKTNEKYLVKIKDCKAAFINKVLSLRKLRHKTYRHQRQSRAVGQALNVAISLASISVISSRIVFLCGGVCTTGFGKVIDQDYKFEMRSIRQPLPHESKQAQQLYMKLGQKARRKNIALDTFIFSVEEVGLTEMLPCLGSCGGLLVQHQQFDSEIFAESFRKAYLHRQEIAPLTLATSVSVEIRTSPEIVLTALQDSRSLKSAQSSIFYLGNIDQTTTLTAEFQLRQATTEAEAYYIQIKSKFKDINNMNLRLERVTTIRRLFVHTTQDMIDNFDQEAALLLLAKLAIYKAQKESSQNLRLWLDNLIIKWAIVFANYRLGDPESFKLPETARAIPQYVYYLRKSPLIRKSRISLDEYTYLSEIMKRQTTRNVLLMIQPALLQYSTEETSAYPISLDEKFMRAQSILLLDSFFNIVEWRGKNINSWFQEDFHHSEEYAYLKEMHENITKDMNHLKHSRFPAPCCYLTSPGHSKQRFIKSRLGTRDEDEEQNNLSEEADINVFTNRLIYLVVVR